MPSLRLHGNDVKSVFQLLGSKENDITFSMAWALSECPVFLDNLVYGIIGTHPDLRLVTIVIQDYKKEENRRGFTDVEITDDLNFHIIIEAKRGWIMPGIAQLEHYSHHFIPVPYKYIVTMSECSQEYASSCLPFDNIANIPLKHIPWLEIYQTAKSSVAKSNNRQKNILNEFITYLEGIITMQNQTSNWVLIVPLNYKKAEGCNLSFIDIVNIKRRYFCKMGAHGIKTPPNYIAFRYNGKLQTIHHIEGYTVTKNMHDEIPEMPDVEWDDDHFIFRLGDAIKPSKDIKTGNVYASGRKWAMLDTLFTAETISEASKISYERVREEESGC